MKRFDHPTHNRVGQQIKDSYGNYTMPTRGPVSRAQLIAGIKEMGMAVTYTNGEYRVTFPEMTLRALFHDCTRAQILTRLEEIAYYTQDAEDALNTAGTMRDQIGSL